MEDGIHLVAKPISTPLLPPTLFQETQPALETKSSSTSLECKTMTIPEQLTLSNQFSLGEMVTNNGMLLPGLAVLPTSLSTLITSLVSPGMSLNGVIQRVSDSTWSIVSEFNGKSTTLNAQVGDYVYNWADVTLEVYQLDICAQFAGGRAYFNKLVLKDKQGDTLNPTWQFTGATSCNGAITQASPSSIYISHN
jgi:hypothetical protein